MCRRRSSCARLVRCGSTAARCAAKWLSRLAVAGRAGGEQVVEVAVDEGVESPTGLDQQPADHLRADAAAGAFGEAEFAGSGEETVEIIGDRPWWQAAPEGGQLAADEVVIARPQVPGEHQEH